MSKSSANGGENGNRTLAKRAKQLRRRTPSCLGANPVNAPFRGMAGGIPGSLLLVGKSFYCDVSFLVCSCIMCSLFGLMKCYRLKFT